jgi:GntR family transcriptional regulator of arabinose operon
MKPKYEMIKEYILESVKSGMFPSGMMIPSESDFCRLFKVSRISVRKAIDELVLREILYRRQGKGTFVANRGPLKQALVNDQKIGILLPFYSEFTEGILSGISKELSNHGYFYKVLQTYGRQSLEHQKLADYDRDGVRGIILLTTFCDESEKNLSVYINRKIPIVFVDRFIENWPFDAVVGKDYEAGFQAVQHLYENHHVRRIGFFSSELQKVTSVSNRLQGTIDAIQRYGLTARESALCLTLAVGANSPMNQNLDRKELKDSIQRFLNQNDDCEAVILSNDLTAAFFLNVCQSNNIKVPEELKLISFMNDEYSTLTVPRLTTFDQNLNELGKLAAKQVITRIKTGGEGEKELVEVPYNLIIRESCGCTHIRGK